MMLYANGCSMTSGEELGGEKYNSDGIKVLDLDVVYKLKHSWPQQLATLLEMDCFNDAKGGASNDRITRTTIKWTAKYLKSNKPEDLFVVIGWSTPSRIEFRIDNRWMTILPQWEPPMNPMKKITKFYVDNIYDEICDNSRTIINVLSLQSWLKVNKIPYLFTNTLLLDYKQMDKDVKNMLDKKRYLHALTVSFNMYEVCNSYPRGPRSHPLKEGHEAWANILQQYIQENKWILKHDNS